MRKLLLWLVMSLLLHTAAWAQNKQELIEISTKHGGDANEISTKNQLRRLLNQYEISKWTFTKKVVVDRDAIPHSHPVLTVHTRHLKDDELLLSTFVHEQIHWFLDQRNEQTGKAVTELRSIFPKVPVGFPDGARDEASSYLHLLICYLEYQAGKELFGELKARQVMEHMTTRHYRWIYKQVLDEERKIAAVIRKYKLAI